MGGVSLTFLAMTASATAPPVDQDQTGGQNGALGVKLLEAGLEVAPNNRGVFWDGATRASGRADGRRHNG